MVFCRIILAGCIPWSLPFTCYQVIKSKQTIKFSIFKVDTGLIPSYYGPCLKGKHFWISNDFSIS